MGQQAYLVPDLIRKEAEAAGLDPAIALAVAEKESNFDPRAIGQKEVITNGVKERAVGTFQFLPSTAKSRGNFDPTDPHVNIREGVRYIKELLTRPGTDPYKALGEYGGVVRDQTYIPDVLQRIKRYQQQVGTPKPPVTPVRPPAAAAAAAAATPPARPVATPEQIASLPARPKTWWERLTGTTTEVPADIQAEMDQTRARLKGVVTGPPAPPWYAPGGDQILDAARSAGHAYDPRERQGRRNIAATAGAIAATPLLLPAGAGALATIGTGALVSGAFGAGAEATEQTVDYLRKGTMPDPMAVGSAGVEQAVMDVAGHAILAPARAVGRAGLGPGLMRDIAETMAKGRDEILGHMDALKDFWKTGSRAFFKDQADRAARNTAATDARVLGARDLKKDAVRQAQDDAAAALGRAEATTRRSVAVGEEIGRGDVDAAKAAADQAQRDLAERYGTTIGPPPSESVIGRQVAGIFDDPLAKEANKLGAAVAETARTGPALDPTPLQDEARRMALEEILPPEREFPRVAGAPPPPPPGTPPLVPTGVLGPDGKPIMRAAAAAPPAPPDIDPLLKAEVTAAERAGMAKHPVMQTIIRILSHEGPVDFYTLHQWKSQLGAQLDFDDPMSNLFEGARKHLFSKIRQMLSVHEPYNAATKAYENVLETTAKGYGKEVAANAVGEPARILQMISPRDPNQTRLLMDALSRHGPKVADSVRHAWIHRNIFQGGLDGLANRAQVLRDNPEFARNLLGSTHKRVLKTLDDWTAAWERSGVEAADTVSAGEKLGRSRVEAARELGEQRLAETRAGSTAATRAAEAAGEAGVRTQKQAGKQVSRSIQQTVRDARFELQNNLGMLATDRRLVSEIGEAEATAIANSGKRAQQILDLVHAGMRPTTYRGSVGLIRLMMGPRSADLLKAASADPTMNRLLIDWLADPNTRVSSLLVKRLIGQEAVEHGPDVYQAVKEQRGAGEPLWDLLGIKDPLAGGPPEINIRIGGPDRRQQPAAGAGGR